MKTRLIQYSILSFIQDPNQLSDKICISTKKEYIEIQIPNLSKSNNSFLMIKILENRYFIFTYNKDELKMGKKEFFEPRQIIYDFTTNKIVVVKAQIYSQIFRMSSQIHIVYNYFFYLQSIYVFPSTLIPALSK